MLQKSTNLLNGLHSHTIQNEAIMQYIFVIFVIPFLEESNSPIRISRSRSINIQLHLILMCVIFTKQVIH